MNSNSKQAFKNYKYSRKPLKYEVQIMGILDKASRPLAYYEIIMTNTTKLQDPTTKTPTALSRIMKTAWFYFKKGIYTTFSESLKAAWKCYRIKTALLNGVVSFSFRKATGEIRQAKGTLNNNHYTFTGKGVRKHSKPDAIKYYDLEKDAWRMFRIERLVSMAA